MSPLFLDIRDLNPVRFLPCDGNLGRTDTLFGSNLHKVYTCPERGNIDLRCLSIYAIDGVNLLAEEVQHFDIGNRGSALYMNKLSCGVRVDLKIACIEVLNTCNEGYRVAAR